MTLSLPFLKRVSFHFIYLSQTSIIGMNSLYFFNYQMASSVKITPHILCGSYSLSKSSQRRAEDEIFSVESNSTLPESEPLLPAAIPRNSFLDSVHRS